MLASIRTTPLAEQSSFQTPVHLAPNACETARASSGGRQPAGRNTAMSSYTPMQDLLHQPASWGEEWLKRLSGPSNPRELFQETCALEDVVAQLMKEQQQLEQQQQQQPDPSPAPQVVAPQPAQDRAVVHAPLQLSSTPLHPPAVPPSTSQPAGDSIDDIWSMLNKPAAASKPPLAPSASKAAVVSHRSTQLEGLYKLLQRFNSTAQGTGASEDTSPQQVARSDNNSCIITSVPGFPEQRPGGATVRAHTDADGAHNLASAFARTSSIEANPQWAVEPGSATEEMELNAEFIEPLPLPGKDEASKLKYMEQCRANRAERMRKRKEREKSSPQADEGEDEDPNDPKVARKMRNRQSAMRSREKRQQYTDKLEAEVAQLKRDKEELATRVEEMQTAATAALTEEQLGILEELRRQVKEFQQRESRLQIPPPRPLRRHHTTPS